MYSKINSMGLLGMNAFSIKVEVDISVGMPAFDVVGLPDAAVKESRDRVRSAMKNCGYQFPVNKITVNLAPADIRKAGPLYDLPIFIAMLLSTDQLSGNFDNSVFLGELALNGEVRPINGVLPMVLQAKNEGFKNIFVPMQNALEGAVVEGIRVFGIEHVNQLIDFLIGAKKLQAALERNPECDLVVAGGVAANSHLRGRLARLTEKMNRGLFIPPISLCGDNAAMIAAAGYYEYLEGNLADASLNASALDTI